MGVKVMINNCEYTANHKSCEGCVYLRPLGTHNLAACHFAVYNDELRGCSPVHCKRKDTTRNIDELVSSVRHDWAGYGFDMED